MQTWLRSQGIKVDLVPRDAHWQLSYPERTVGILKDMLDAMVRSFPDADPSELLGRSLAALNDMLKTPGGASPFQRLIAHTPLTTLDIGQEPENLPLLTAEGCAEDEFGKSAELRSVARHSFLEAEAKYQVRVAQASQHRAFKVYHTGDWVYVWRQLHKTHRPVGSDPARSSATRPRIPLRPGASPTLLAARAVSCGSSPTATS